VSTGSYALNRIISGDIYKGIPNGRVVIFSGESASGKSLFAAEITANALEHEDFDIIFYFDSEGGGLKSFFEGRGCDLDKIEHVPLENVEDATVKILAVYSQLKEERKAVEETQKELQKKINEILKKKRPGIFGPIQTDLGYHLVEVKTWHDRGSIKSLDEVWEEIAARLSINRQRHIETQLVDSLRKSGSILFNKSVLYNSTSE